MIQEKLIYISLILFCLGVKCGTSPVGQYMQEPEFEESDRKYAGVFSSLDGTWKGTSLVYRNKSGQSQKFNLTTPIDMEYLNTMDLEIIDKINVTQHYESHSPYYQRVKIIDEYQHAGKPRIQEAHGVNKVENGMLWCVVEKPDELVVHKGTLEGTHTIIWSRNEHDPLKKEFFRETVREEWYTIVGYGYYGADDPDLEPVTWFYGEYQRIR